MAAGDQFPLLPSVASFAIDYPPGQVIFFFFVRNSPAPETTEKLSK
jgi:hypothetical protein